MRVRRRSLGALAGGVAALALGVAPALAAPNPPPRVPISGAASLHGVTLLPPVASSQPLSFRINLVPRDPAGAERYATAVATPGSGVFGQFLTEAQFQARFGAPTERVAALRDWLAGQHLQVEQIIGNQVVLVHGTAHNVSAAFATRIATIRSAGSLPTRAAVTPLQVPARFAGLVGGVSGLAPGRQFSTSGSGPGPRVIMRSDQAGSRRAAAAAAAPAKDPTCPSYFGEFPVTGVPRPPFGTRHVSYVECSLVHNPFTNQLVYAPGASTAKLRRLSNLNTRYTGRGITVGVLLWNNEPKGRGLADYAAKVNGVQPLRIGQLRSILTGAGGSDCQPIEPEDKTEISLDIQSVHSFAPDAAIRFYGSTRCVVPDVSLAMALAESAPPSVIANSWGSPHYDYDPADPVARSLHNSLVKAAIRGVSVLFSAGDTGDGTQLRTNFPGVSPPAPLPARTPGYPATDPYSVTVGGVGFGTGPDGGPAFKQAWTPRYYSNPQGNPNWYSITAAMFGGGPNAIGTTGGTSRIFGAPPWQRSAGVSTTGRKVPDLSNAADPFFGPEFVAVGVPNSTAVEIITVGGTSMSAPLTAGQVATANEYQRRAYLGLITPTLYRLRASTTVSDVQRFQSGIVVKGFFPNGLNLLVGEELPQESLITSPGWDNATGLGTPGTGFIGNIGR